MIRLKTLLESDNNKLLNVLFIGNWQTSTSDSYANLLLSKKYVTGDIITYKSIDKLPNILDTIPSDKKYDAIVILPGSINKLSNETVIRLLKDAYSTAKTMAPAVISATIPGKLYTDINKWILSQRITDSVINTNQYKRLITVSKDNTIKLTPEFHQKFSGKLQGILNNIHATKSDSDGSVGDTASATTDTNITPGAVFSAATIGASEYSNANEVINFFVNKGLTPEQASGIAGNISVESGFNTGAVGDSGTSVGIAQWHDNRASELKNWLTKNNYSFTDITGQLEYLWHELQTTEKRALDKILQTATPDTAANAFAKYFERPTFISPARLSNAIAFFKNWKK